MTLTADGVGLPEDLCHLRVHFDHQVLLLGDLSVAGIHLLIDPFNEVLLEDCREDVDHPLLRRLGQFQLSVWQVLEDDRVPGVGPFNDVLHSKSIVPNQNPSNHFIRSSKLQGLEGFSSFLISRRTRISQF